MYSMLYRAALVGLCLWGVVVVWDLLSLVDMTQPEAQRERIGFGADQRRIIFSNIAEAYASSALFSRATFWLVPGAVLATLALFARNAAKR